MKVSSLATTATTQVSHNGNISRKRLIEFGEIAHLTNFSQATFPPGEIAWAHQHKDMVEVFFIQSGTATMIVNDEEIILEAGSCIRIDINETHQLENRTAEPLTVLYFGVATSS